MDATMDMFCIRVARVDTNERSLRKLFVAALPATLLPRAAGLEAAQQEQSLSHGAIALTLYRSCLNVGPVMGVQCSHGRACPVRVPPKLSNNGPPIVATCCCLQSGDKEKHARAGKAVAASVAAVVTEGDRENLTLLSKLASRLQR